MTRSRSRFLTLVILLLTFLSFQNCTGVQFDASTPNVTSQAANIFNWHVTPGTTCSVACGSGITIDTVVCQNGSGATVPDSFCSGTKPPTSHACNIATCGTYSWSTSGFGACSVTCGTGVQTQTVHCIDSGGNVVDPSLCSATPAPPGSQACNLPACSVPPPTPQVAAGNLCGYYSPFGGPQINCNGMNPLVGCPAGFTQQDLITDNGVGQFYTCVASATASVSSGALCGWYSPFGGALAACGGSSPLNGCPAGYVQQDLLTDNGVGQFYTCVSTASATTLPSGSLCGWYSPFAGPQINCAGANPLMGCTSAYTQMDLLTNNGVGQGYVCVGK